MCCTQPTLWAFVCYINLVEIDFLKIWSFQTLKNPLQNIIKPTWVFAELLFSHTAGVEKLWQHLLCILQGFQFKLYSPILRGAWVKRVSAPKIVCHRAFFGNKL